MSQQRVFSRFLELPAELQVAIVEHALHDSIRQRDGRLTIRYHLKKGFGEDREATYCNVRLPSLPALYHANHLFRTEAIRAQPMQQLFDVPLKRQNPRSLERHPCGSMVVFNTTHDTLDILYQRPYDPWEPQLRFLFQAMSNNVKASIQYMSIVQAYSDTSCKREIIVNVLWDPLFAALPEFSTSLSLGPCSHPNSLRTRREREMMDYRYKLMDCGDVCEYHGRSEEPTRRYPLTPLDFLIEKFAQKRSLLEQARI
jgi:hypothetical protein